MYYETDTNDHGLRHNPLKACVVPRPIGWMTTINPAGVVNLAPFSFFNLLSYDPPYVLFSAGVHEVDGGKKDSLANVEATGEFVYNMATWAQKDQMNETARIVERGVDEMTAVGLEPLPSRLVRPRGSKAHRYISSAACTRSLCCRAACRRRDTMWSSAESWPSTLTTPR